jgi:hypothetical protein
MNVERPTSNFEHRTINFFVRRSTLDVELHAVRWTFVFLLLLASCRLLPAASFGALMPTPELSSSGLPQDVVAELATVYRAAFVELGRIVEKPWGNTPLSKEWKQARAASLSYQIDQMLRGLGQQSAHFFGQQMPKVFIDGIQKAQTQARAVGIDAPPLGLSARFSLIDRRALEVLANDAVKDLHKTALNTGEQAKMLLRRTAQADLSQADIDQVIQKGIIIGSPAEAIRNLRDQFRAVTDGKVRIKDKNGDQIEYDAGDYARMVIRSKTRQAMTASRHQRLEELGLDLVSIVGRVSKYFCTAYLGQVFSLSGKDDKYPAITELPGYGYYGPVPPFHPDCSKSTRPFVVDLASEKQLDMAEGTDDEGQMLNVDTNTAQRKFKDLQIYQQVKSKYATTAKELFGAKS